MINGWLIKRVWRHGKLKLITKCFSPSSEIRRHLNTISHFESETASPQVPIPDLEVAGIPSNFSARFPDLSALFPDIGLALPMSGEKLPASRSRPRTMKLLAACFVSHIVRNSPTHWTSCFRRRRATSACSASIALLCSPARAPWSAAPHTLQGALCSTTAEFDLYSHKSHTPAHISAFSRTLGKRDSLAVAEHALK